MKIYDPFDRIQQTSIIFELATKHDDAAGHAHQENVCGRHHAQPQMKLKNGPVYARFLRMLQPLPPWPYFQIFCGLGLGVHFLRCDCTTLPSSTMVNLSNSQK